MGVSEFRKDFMLTPLFIRSKMRDFKEQLKKIHAEIEETNYAIDMEIFGKRDVLIEKLNSLKDELRNVYSEAFEQFLN